MLRAEHVCNQSTQVEGRIHRELLQLSGRVQYQLLMAAGHTHLHAIADEGLTTPLTTILDRGTSSSPATVGNETFLLQPMRTTQLRHLQPLYDQQGHRGREGVKEGGEREESATQHSNSVHLYSAACHD